MTTRRPSLTLMYTPARLGDILDALDDLHTAVSDGTLTQTASIARSDLREWLQEIVYLATQTLNELDSGCDMTAVDRTEVNAPALRLVRKFS